MAWLLAPLCTAVFLFGGYLGCVAAGEALADAINYWLTIGRHR